jgi:CheY-like chemotaxis protein
MTEHELPQASLEAPDVDLREAYQDILELRGFRVEGVGTGLEALRTLLRLKPTVMILDLNLPGGYSGTQVLVFVRSHPSLWDTRVIVISGQENAGASARFMKPDRFLAKPVSAEDLIESVMIIQYGS